MMRIGGGGGARRAGGKRGGGAAGRSCPLLMLMLNECHHMAWHGGVMVPCVGVDERSTIDDESTVAVGCCCFV